MGKYVTVVASVDELMNDQSRWIDLPLCRPLDELMYLLSYLALIGIYPHSSVYSEYDVLLSGCHSRRWGHGGFWNLPIGLC